LRVDQVVAAGVPRVRMHLVRSLAAGALDLIEHRKNVLLVAFMLLFRQV